MCVYIYIHNLYMYKKDWGWTLLCKCRYKSYINYNNILLGKGNTSSLYYTTLKLNFVLSCWFFEIEKKYLMIQHSEDRCVFVKEEHASLLEIELFFRDL